jgi:hypothetical protein
MWVNMCAGSSQQVSFLHSRLGSIGYDMMCIRSLIIGLAWIFNGGLQTISSCVRNDVNRM